MMVIAKLVATNFGIGYIRKGAGTVAALFFCLAWWLIAKDVATSNYFLVIINLVLLLAGTWSSFVVEKEWGKDSNRVVVDEVSGMAISLLWVPVRWEYLLIAFILFRFFDIVKPLFIRRAESLPSGWGVMADDVLAGIYTNLIVQLLIMTAVFS